MATAADRVAILNGAIVKLGELPVNIVIHDESVHQTYLDVLSLMHALDNLLPLTDLTFKMSANSNIRATQAGYQGWVTKPTVFLAGEAGSEYVSVTPKSKVPSAAPMPAHAGVSGSGQELHLHIDGKVETPDELMDKLDRWWFKRGY